MMNGNMASKASKQYRLARELLKISPYDLAERAGLDVVVVFQIENPHTLVKINPICIKRIQHVLCRAGIHFVGNQGVKLLHRPRL